MSNEQYSEQRLPLLLGTSLGLNVMNYLVTLYRERKEPIPVEDVVTAVRDSMGLQRCIELCLLLDLDNGCAIRTEDDRYYPAFWVLQEMEVS